MGSQVYQEAEGPEGQGGAVMVSAVVRSTPSAAFDVCAHASLAESRQSLTPGDKAREVALHHDLSSQSEAN